MASEVNLTQTQQALMRRILVPKHVGGLDKKRRKDRVKSLMRAGEGEREGRKKEEKRRSYLQPFEEIEDLMRHFNANFEGEKAQKKNDKHRRIASVRADLDRLPIEKKINNLINLPALKTIKTQAQRYRSSPPLSDPQPSAIQLTKASILTNFHSYMQSQLKCHPPRSSLL